MSFARHRGTAIQKDTAEKTPGGVSWFIVRLSSFHHCDAQYERDAGWYLQASQAYHTISRVLVFFKKHTPKIDSSQGL